MLSNHFHIKVLAGGSARRIGNKSNCFTRKKNSLNINFVNKLLQFALKLLISQLIMLQKACESPKSLKE